MKKISVLLLLLSLFSCSKNEEDNGFNGIMYHFHPRECKYMWAYNVSETETDIYGLPYIKRDYISRNQSVNITDYALEFTTCNIDMDAVNYSDGMSYKEVYESGNEDILFNTPVYEMLWHANNLKHDESDKIIETKLLAYFEKSTNKVNYARSMYANITHVDYRTTPILNLKITASSDINNVKAGESLNKMFLVSGYAKDHHFIITSNKDIVTDKDKISKITIEQYLYYHPMAPAALTLKFNDDIDINTPTETTFTVEITTLDGMVVKSVTPLVTITPKIK